MNSGRASLENRRLAQGSRSRFIPARQTLPTRKSCPSVSFAPPSARPAWPRSLLPVSPPSPVGPSPVSRVVPGADAVEARLADLGCYSALLCCPLAPTAHLLHLSIAEPSARQSLPSPSHPFGADSPTPPPPVRHSSHAASESYDDFNRRYSDFFASAQVGRLGPLALTLSLTSRAFDQTGPLRAPARTEQLLRL